MTLSVLAYPLLVAILEFVCNKLEVTSML